MRTFVGWAAVAAAVLLASGCGGGGADSAQAIREFLSASSRAKAAAALDELSRVKPDDAARIVFCNATSSYVQTGDAPSGSDWANAVLAELHIPQAELSEKADQFGAALTFAQSGNGSTAAAYLRACPLHD